jgi:starvation-inducible DNA-binding protein
MNTIVKPKQFENHQPLPQNVALSPDINDTDFIRALNQNLANVLDLRSRAKQAHWNAKGGGFYALHKMLNDFCDSLDSIGDELGERIMVLGGVALGAPHDVVKNSSLPPPAIQSANADRQIKVLIDCYAAASRSCEVALLTAIRADHHVSAAILTGLAKLLDTQRAFLAAHIVPTAAAQHKR